MAWCEQNGVDFLFGLVRNPRLVEHIHVELAWAEHDADAREAPAYVVQDTLDDGAGGGDPAAGGASARGGGGGDRDADGRRRDAGRAR